MTICFIDTLGLRYTGDTVYKRGLGGSESAIIYLGEELATLGFDVWVYNHCEEEGTYKGVKYRDINTIRENTRVFDILISSRSILPLVPQQFGNEVWNKFNKDIGIYENITPQAKFKVVWMHDTFLEGEEYLEALLVSGNIQEVFLLSDWHSHYISQSDHWGTRKRDYASLKQYIFQTRNGMHPYAKPPKIEDKDPNLFVYNSSVSKGMIALVRTIWPKIKKELPLVKLVVIGGYYRGAGKNETADEQEKTYFSLRETFDGQQGITFTGIITQEEIAKILSKTTFMIYPPVFPETFGISTLEALYYNVVPITSRFGALEQTAVHEMSYLMNYDIPEQNTRQIETFIALVKMAYSNVYLTKQKQYKCNEIRDWVSWGTVALQWKAHFYRKFDMMMDREEIEKVRTISSTINHIFKTRHINLEDQREFFPIKKEKRLVIISPVFNASGYIEKCITSVAMQLYDNYIQYIIDDCSTDETLNVVAKTIESLSENLKQKFLVIKNAKNVGALANQITTITDVVKDDDIILLLDGDDWLYNDPDIFSYINNLYPRYEMSYGSCWSLADQIPLIAQEYPEEVKKTKGFRDYKFSWGIPYTHLRTFSYELFNKIDKSSLLDPSTTIPYKAGGDGALLYALLEVCDLDKIKCVQRLLVNYNDKNPLNDYKVNGEEQNANRDVIASGIKELDNRTNGQKVNDFIQSHKKDGYIQVNNCKYLYHEGEDYSWLFQDCFGDICGKEYLGIDFYHEGPYESELIKLNTGDIVIDAGASIGVFATYACSKNCTVYAFEPYPKNIEYLNEIKVLNPQFDLHIIPYALSDVESTEILKSTDGGDLGGATIMEDIANENAKRASLLNQKVTTIQVQTITLDLFCERYSLPRVDFIKADIEGAEIKLMNGAIKVLSMYSPKLALSTYHRSTDSDDLTKIISTTNSKYSIYPNKNKLLAYCSTKKTMNRLSDIHKDVLARKLEAVVEYKEVVSSREDVWVDPIEAKHIFPRVKWLKDQFSNLKISKDASILDVGSWTGSVSNELYLSGYHNISCLDISSKAIEFGNAMFPQFYWICRDIENFVSIKKYDIIFMMEVIEHLVSPIDTLKRLLTYLTPMGKIFYTIPTEKYVFDREHISIITEQQLLNLNSQPEILKIDDFSWYVGHISNVNKKLRKKIMKSILIGIPTAKYIESDTFKSIYDLEILEGFKSDFQFFYGYNIAQIRNLMADYTIKNKFDYIFWVDSDIILPKDALTKLLGHNKQCIAGVYLQRKPEEIIPEVYFRNETNGVRNAKLEEILKPQLISVAGAGFGCMLTTRQILEIIGYPQFEYKNSLDHRYTISEDVDFCTKVIKTGEQIFVDTSIRCSHIGTHIYKVD